ncbi:hypothetical protein SALBM311S_10700 [Streptomyces alboniger]
MCGSRIATTARITGTNHHRLSVSIRLGRNCRTTTRTTTATITIALTSPGIRASVARKGCRQRALRTPSKLRKSAGRHIGAGVDHGWIPRADNIHPWVEAPTHRGTGTPARTDPAASPLSARPARRRNCARRRPEASDGIYLGSLPAGAQLLHLALLPSPWPWPWPWPWQPTTVGRATHPQRRSQTRYKPGHCGQDQSPCPPPPPREHDQDTPVAPSPNQQRAQYVPAKQPRPYRIPGRTESRFCPHTGRSHMSALVRPAPCPLAHSAQPEPPARRQAQSSHVPCRGPRPDPARAALPVRGPSRPRTPCLIRPFSNSLIRPSHLRSAGNTCSDDD